ncbi:MAG: hypothetical protein AAGB35_07570 [Pseudomonadota bacterium]
MLTFLSSAIFWTALSAIATFLVATIALLPIFREGFANKAKARALRVMLMVNFSKVRPTFEYLEGVRERENTVILPEKYILEIANRLQDYSSSLYLLTTHEQDEVSKLIINFIYTAELHRDEKLSKDDAHQLVAHINKVEDLFSQHGYYHKEDEELPSSMD